MAILSLISRPNWRIAGLVLLLLIMSVYTIDNITIAISTTTSLSYLHRQLTWILIGLNIATVICFIDYRILKDLSYWFYIVINLLLVAVLYFNDYSSDVTSHWLTIGFISIQPSEPMKIVLLITLARYFSNIDSIGSLKIVNFTVPLILISLPVLLILMQPDLGTAIVVIMTTLPFFYCIGMNWSSILSLTLTLIPSCWLIWNYVLHDYQKSRINAFLNHQNYIDHLANILPNKIALNETHNIIAPFQNTYASHQFRFYLNEMGVIGVLLLIIIYLYLVKEGLEVAQHCSDRFGSLLAIGISATIFFHVIFCIGVLVGIFPMLSGLTLPFFSYGGTSMITFMVCIGLLLNISIRGNKY